jgi:hypothetical protein
MSHGSMFATNTDGKVKLKMTKIPKRMKLFNKLTYSLVGYPNFASEQIEKDQIEEYTRKFAEFNEPGNAPLIGDELKEFIQQFETYKPKLKVLKDAWTENGLREVKPLLTRPKSLFQVSLNNTYSDKIFLRKPGKDFETTDIFVVFAKGGTPGKQFEVGEQILKHRKITRSYKFGGQIITLKELLNMCLNRGYNKVVMIDYSCETCYQLEDDNEYEFTPTYEYINADDESPGRLLEKLPYNPHPISDRLKTESYITLDKIYEIDGELEKLESGDLAKHKSKIDKLKQQKMDLEKQYEEEQTEIDRIYNIEHAEWTENYDTPIPFKKPYYQYKKSKQPPLIIDPKTFLTFERHLTSTKTRGGK